MGGGSALPNAGYRALHDLYVTQLQALPLSVFLHLSFTLALIAMLSVSFTRGLLQNLNAFPWSDFSHLH